MKAVADKQKLWNANQKPPVFKVHGFYLVHEDVLEIRLWQWVMISLGKCGRGGCRSNKLQG